VPDALSTKALSLAREQQEEEEREKKYIFHDFYILDISVQTNKLF